MKAYILEQTTLVKEIRQKGLEEQTAFSERRQ